MSGKCGGSNRKIPRVFLIVTIPTHLRVMMDVADLLRSSGRFDPQILYYPSEVFDRNHENCAQATHASFIWAGGKFWSPDGYLFFQGNKSGLYGLSECEGKAPLAKRGVRRFLNRGIYRRLLRWFPFLPSSPKILAAVYWLRSVLLGVAQGYGLLKLATVASIELVLDLSRSSRGASARLETWPQIVLRSYFGREWRAATAYRSGHNASFLQRLKTPFSEGILGGLGRQKAFYQGLLEILEKHEPVLVVLPEENLFYDSHLAVSAARSLHIPCVVVPFTIANTLEWAEAFYDVKQYQVDSVWKRILAHVFPKWVLHHRGRCLILPAVHILACEYLDVVPDQPWVISSGPADAIAAESRFMSDYYLRAGIRPGKIRLTGALSDDKLYQLLQSREAQRTALTLRSGLALHGKVVLIGLPPDQFGGGRREGCEFENYEALVRYMVGTVAAQCGDATLLINLHPRVRRENVAYLEALGATIIVEPIEHLVPLADVYVSVVSATIRLAIACGIPVINYDAYQYDYDDYKDLPGVLEVKTKESFSATTEALIKDAAFYIEVHQAQQETAHHLCGLDGNAGARMLALFDELSANRLDQRQVSVAR